MRIEQSKRRKMKRAIKVPIAALLSLVSFSCAAQGVAAGSGSVRTGPGERAVADPILGLSTIALWQVVPHQRAQGVDDVPSLTVFRPHGVPNGTAVIIAPGGAYRGLAGDLEGRQVADWFSAQGVTAFVLRYRFGPNYTLPIPLDDGQRAVRLVRAMAVTFSINPAKIGFVGFSAGGHLAALVATEKASRELQKDDPVDRQSSRPDFIVLAYPAFSMFDLDQRSEVAYCRIMKMPTGSCNGDYLKRWSPQNHVDALTPPAFIYHTVEDELIPVEGSVEFFRRMRSAGVSAEMHLFGTGHHGSGLGKRDQALGLWPELLRGWLINRVMIGR